MDSTEEKQNPSDSNEDVSEEETPIRELSTQKTVAEMMFHQQSNSRVFESSAKETENEKQDHDQEEEDNNDEETYLKAQIKKQNKESSTQFLIGKTVANKIFYSNPNLIRLKTQLSISNELPNFDSSSLIILETLGKGGFGLVEKAYDKIRNEFVAIKTMLKAVDSNELEGIKAEDVLLRSVEDIRLKFPTANQHFLKYDGLFKDSNDPKKVIFKMESGCATLDNILEAGKVFPQEELLFVLKKLIEGFALLQEYGIANRDVKSQNIILVEDNSKEGHFLFKISDFGIGCHIEDKSLFVSTKSLSGLTSMWAAPEVLTMSVRSCKEPENEEYNPFLGDVYSLGLLALKMINNSFGKDDIIQVLLHKETLLGYQTTLEILELMLEENPQKRWDFVKLDTFLRWKKDDPKYSTKAPEDLVMFYRKWLVEIKEKRWEKNLKRLEILFNEHKKLYEAYNGSVTRPQGAKFHLDRLHQIVKKMKENYEKNANKDNEQIMNILHKNIYYLIEKGDWHRKMGNLTRSMRFLKKAMSKLVNLNVEFVEESNRKNQSQLLGEALGKFGLLFDNLGNLTASETCYLTALDLKGFEMGECEASVAEILNNIAIHYDNDNMGNLKKAKDCHLKALNIRMKCFGKHDKTVANSLNDYALLLSNLGNLKKAKLFFKKALKIRQKLFGTIHADVAESFSNLGQIYRKLSNFEKSESHYLKSLEIRRIIFGEKHSQIAISLNNLAFLFDCQGLLEKAELFYLEAFEIFSGFFGEKHPDVATTLSNLGVLYDKKEDFDKAEKFHSRALGIRLELFGEKHADVADSVNNLGFLYRGANEFNRAEEFYLRALEIRKGLFGEKHADVADSYDNLAFIYQKQGKLDKAEELYLKALQIRQELFKEKHTDIADSLNNIGGFYDDKGDMAKAEAYFLKAFEMRRDLFGKDNDNEDVLSSMEILENYYERLGNKEKAQEFKRQQMK